MAINWPRRPHGVVYVPPFLEELEGQALPAPVPGPYETVNLQALIAQEVRRAISLLVGFLGLPEDARRLVLHLLERPGDGAALSVLADILEEQGKAGQAERLRRLT